MFIRWRPVVSEALRVGEELIEALRQPPVLWTLAAITGLLVLRLVAGSGASAQPVGV